jgi:type VI secretion system protein ImpK
MSTDDPFLTPNDNGDRTVLRPSPGGQRRGGTGPSPAVASPGTAAAFSAFAAGTNHLVDAAAQLIALIGRLKNITQHNDIAGLHRQMIQAIQNFENTARSSGASPEGIIAGRYALCAAIDEAVLNTPWGSSSLWSNQTMLSTFHQETSGGEKFFLILDRIRQEPARNIDLLELYALCLAMGFEGKFRIQDNGRVRLDGLREELFQVIRGQRGEYERELSPHWRGHAAPKTALRQQVPYWVIAALTGAVLLSIYIGFNWILHHSAAPVVERLERILPHSEAENN